jgi:hypothetical protein
VGGVPESGFFMDLPDLHGVPSYTPLFKHVAAMQNVSGSLNRKCTGANRGEEWRCFMAQHALPYTQTPFFAVNSVYDQWQAATILRVDGNCLRAGTSACTSAEAKALNGLRAAILGNLTRYTAMRNRSGYFLYNCGTHCGQFDHDGRWSNLDDSAVSLRDAFTAWMVRDKAVRSIGAAGVGWGPQAYATCT